MKASNQRRVRRSNLGALPLTSMIDVVFLLLIFFLVTSNFAKEEFKLPSALQTDGGGVRANDMQPQIVQIRISNNSSVFVMGESVFNSQQSLEEFLLQLPKDPGVVIRSDPDVPISSIGAALQAARNAGFQRRSYVPSDGS